MAIEKRQVKMQITSPGGTASKGSHSYRLTIPNAWAKKLNVNEDSRDFELCFDGKTIQAIKKDPVDREDSTGE